jgi:hypothetical protein
LRPLRSAAQPRPEAHRILSNITTQIRAPSGSPFAPARLVVFPEVALNVDIEDRRNLERPTKLRITGKAIGHWPMESEKSLAAGRSFSVFQFFFLPRKTITSEPF